MAFAVDALELDDEEDEEGEDLGWHEIEAKSEPGPSPHDDTLDHLIGLALPGPFDYMNPMHVILYSSSPDD